MTKTTTDMTSAILRIVFHFTLICLTGTVLSAQTWIASNGIEGKTVRALLYYNTDTLLAGVDNEGVYISYDNGTNWAQFAINGESVYSLTNIENTIIAGTYGNDIKRFTLVDVQSDNVFINDLVIHKLSIHNDMIYACTYGLAGPGAIYFSSDTGATWTQFVTTPPYGYLDIDFNSQGRAFVATPFGAYYSDGQSPWTQTTGFGSTVRTVAMIGIDSLIYSSELGIHLSTNNGVSGQQVAGAFAGTLHYLNDTFYVARPGSGLYYSNEIGSNWTNLFMPEFVLSLLNVNGKLIAGTPDGVFVLSNSTTNIDHIGEMSTNVQIYPNPFTDKISVNTSSSGSMLLSIFDATGKLIVRSTEKNIIDVSFIESGLYYYTIVFQHDTIQTGKIVKH